MNRPLSPIRHDYKPTATSKAKSTTALPWFAAGLGLPLLGIAVLLAVGNETEEEAEMAAVEALEVTEALEVSELPVVAEPVVADSIELEATDIVEIEEATVATDEFHPPLALPPEYEKLHLTSKRGDTLDRLFRRNDLNLSDLAMMVKVPEAAPHLKKLIPGDELTIEHDEGRLMSLYREIDLTNALLISKTDDGFTTEVIERPLEVRRKASYGRIQTSLYESASEAGLPDKTVMNLAGIFAWDVDFVLDIRRGDDYYVLYEQLFQDGEYMGDGEVIA